MAYKILNNISVKDSASSDLASLKTSMLVITIDKNTKKDKSFRALDKAAKGFLSSTVASHLNDEGSSISLPSIDGINAENILLVKSWDAKTPTHKWLGSIKSITKQANKLKAKDISFVINSSYPINKDVFWMIESVSKTIESNAYIFTETKNKTVKKPTLKKLVLFVSDMNPSDLRKAKSSAKKGFAIGEGVNTAKYLGDLPANHATPKIIEKKVKAMTKDFPNLKVKSFNERKILLKWAWDHT